MKLRHTLPLFFAPLFLGCAASGDVDPDVQTDESELRAPCEIGVSCASPLVLVRSVHFGTQPPARFRADVDIEQSTWPRTPRVLRQLTTGPMTAKAEKTLSLRAFEVDNLVLFEVLDAATGARLDAAFAGFVEDATVKLSGAPVKRLGHDSFSFADGVVDLGPILPRDRAFRLRVSALDHGGLAHVSDVVAVAADVRVEPPPPPPPVASDRTQSVLRDNTTPLARDFTAALDTWTVKQRYDMQYGFPFYKMLVHGFSLEGVTHAAFGNETSHFNITPLAAVDRAWLDGVIAWWQPKIHDLRAAVLRDYGAGLITTGVRDRKIAVLDGLQGIVDRSFTPLRATFERYPEVAKVTLDLP